MGSSKIASIAGTFSPLPSIMLSKETSNKDHRERVVNGRKKMRKLKIAYCHRKKQGNT